MATGNNGMTLTQLINAVYVETNRPDLVAETQQAVLEAILSVHTLQDWYKDITESVVVFDNGLLYLQTLDTLNLPFMRKVAYIRKTSPQQATYEQTNTLLPQSPLIPPNNFDFLDKVEIGNVLDGYGRERRDIWYQAGSQLNIKSSTQLQYATVGYYQYPNISNSGAYLNSWIANEFPYVIVYKASGAVFGKIGDTSSNAIYMKPPVPRAGKETGGMYYQQLAILEQNNIE